MAETPAYYFFKNVALFADLDDQDLKKICETVREIHLLPGDILFQEGSIGQEAYVIKDGQIEIYKNSNGVPVQLAIRKPGEVIGEMAILESAPRNASGKAISEATVLGISQDQFQSLINASPQAARTMLHTVTTRLKSTEASLRQSEKMAQLGTFTAGIAHELNNPSAAVMRSAGSLLNEINQIEKVFATILAQGFSSHDLETITTRWEHFEQNRLGQGIFLDPIARMDIETELEQWLESHGVQNTWELIPELVEQGIDSKKLSDLMEGFDARKTQPALQWVAQKAKLKVYVGDIHNGADRISTIVKALKSYVYLDQSPIQEVDLHEGLENTLTILKFKLDEGIEIHRDYNRSIPYIPAYGSELNQVWTNLIDNAIDAMNGKGHLYLQTCNKDPWIEVVIEDTGPGIPPENLHRLFTPFFTTKPVGKGTGLGLNISYNIIQKHGGDIRVESQPGKTRFIIQLPVSTQKKD
jgi:signal transduction histidine kinase